MGGCLEPERRRRKSVPWEEKKTKKMASNEATERIVVMAVDSSDDAKFAFDWFLDNIYKPNDVLILTHCPEPPKLPTFSFKSGIAPPVHEWKIVLDEMNAATRKLEEDYEGTCIQKKLNYKVRGESMKNPGEGIVKIAEEENADLICMGSRGLGRMKRALMGSVSDYVAHNCTCPIIIIPARRMDGI